MIKARRRDLADSVDDSGASAVEYGLVLVAIAAVIALVVFSLGVINRNSFDSSCDKIKTQVTNSGCNS